MRVRCAYAVLGETDKAMDAYDRAALLRPDGLDVRLQELAALFNQRAPSASVPPRLEALLTQVAAAAPDQPEVLWYQGLAAAQRDQLVAAQGYWQRLLAMLPADSQEHKLVESALKALDRK